MVKICELVDHSIFRHFVATLLSSIGPPYSSTFIQSASDLLLHPASLTALSGNIGSIGEAEVAAQGARNLLVDGESVDGSLVSSEQGDLGALLMIFVLQVADVNTSVSDRLKQSLFERPP